NTLGAVLGTVLSTFFLLERLGTRETLWGSCALNAAVGLIAMSLSKRWPAVAIAQPEMVTGSDAAPKISDADLKSGRRKRSKRERKGAEMPLEAQAAPRAREGTRNFVLFAAAATGFSFTLMEIVWYRMLAPLLGGSTYTLGLIPAIAVLVMGLGSLARSSRREPGTLAGFAVTCATEALVLAVPYALGDSVAITAALLRPLGAVGFGGFI